MILSTASLVDGGGPDSTDAVTDTKGIETAANYGISEALLNDPVYGTELSAVYAFLSLITLVQRWMHYSRQSIILL